MKTARSHLFVPGDRPDRFDKALGTGADAVVLDLEDAVDPTDKVAARESIGTFLAGEGAAVMVRVNGAETSWFDEDVATIAALPRLGGIMLPKCEHADVIETIAAKLRSDQTVVALIETVRGYFNLRAVAGARGLSRIAFGAADFGADAGISGEDEELHAVRSQLVLESRFADLPAPVDGVTVDFRNADALARDVARSLRFGFGGKLCIHPSQVEAVNRGYMPGQSEIDWAGRVLEAVASSAGATSVDGKLVDKPIIDRARAILARRDAFAHARL